MRIVEVRKSLVDRNRNRIVLGAIRSVEVRKSLVDRNILFLRRLPGSESRFARASWIETISILLSNHCYWSRFARASWSLVDRNGGIRRNIGYWSTSRFARASWIETVRRTGPRSFLTSRFARASWIETEATASPPGSAVPVEVRKSLVDRNYQPSIGWVRF